MWFAVLAALAGVCEGLTSHPIFLGIAETQPRGSNLHLVVGLRILTGTWVKY